MGALENELNFRGSGTSLNELRITYKQVIDT